MQEVLKRIEACGILPVAVIEQADRAPTLAQALLRGGLSGIEVTFRTEAAAEAIVAITKQCPDMLVGAGTVLTIEQVKQARQAGAAFMVSPGLNPRVVEYCLQEKIPVVPGCLTPSDMERALEYGLEAVKFFPAEAAGGLTMLRALAAPYRKLRFMPTGGINADNVGAYLAWDRVFACGGSWMVKDSLLAKEDYAQIEKLAAEVAVLVKESRRPAQ